MLKQKANCNLWKNPCFSKEKEYIYKSDQGLSKDVVRKISSLKKEPKWMLDYRLKSFEYFKSKKLPKWGPNLLKLNFDKLCYYIKPTKKHESSWNDIPLNIKSSFDDTCVRKIEKQNFAGVGAQYESEIVYHNLKKEWEKKGVIFLGTDQALKEFPQIFKEYFGTVVQFNDNKFAALNSAFWSGGSFIYIPKGVKVDVPLQAYYKIDSQNLGQFERTLIIADQGSCVSYVEGCTAEMKAENSLHSAVVEIIAKRGSRVKYYTIQNWTSNIYNLVTKRAVAYKDAIVEWVDCNIGSNVTMKYPAVILKGDGAKTDMLSLAIASFSGQIQDSGAKAIHLASNTSSKIISKSISSNGGRSSFRGLIKVEKEAKNCKSYVQCDSLIMDNISQADSYPYFDIRQKDVNIGHEARISRIEDNKIFYLMSRGVSRDEAQSLIINGFIESFVKELPFEYAVEINRLIDFHMKRGGDEK
ncbi:Fe-S cluster assembly protein SufB [Candidatus Babeliales bacterium]|nr:Fe-S cluster assembly protein SufB [Candidatus Babeliales bacterium]